MLKLTILAVLIAVTFAANAQRQQRSRLLSGYGQQPVQNNARAPLLALDPTILAQNPCTNMNVGDRIIDSSNSSQFYHCTEENGWELMACPRFLVFNTYTLRCENSMSQPKGCLSNPCQNNGNCVDLPLFQWRCDCLLGFSGDFCETHDGCDFDTDNFGNVCIPLPASYPISKYYICGDHLETFGLDCRSSFETNPCLINMADLKSFPLKSNSAFYVHCEGQIPHLKFCNYPLVYNHALQQCDWIDESVQAQVEQQIQVPAQVQQSIKSQVQSEAQSKVQSQLQSQLQSQRQALQQVQSQVQSEVQSQLQSQRQALQQVQSQDTLQRQAVQQVQSQDSSQRQAVQQVQSQRQAAQQAPLQRQAVQQVPLQRQAPLQRPVFNPIQSAQIAAQAVESSEMSDDLASYNYGSQTKQLPVAQRPSLRLPSNNNFGNQRLQ